MRTWFQILSLIVVVLFASAATAFAGNTGKIVGKIVDDGGQPVIGASVQVEGTTRGAATDPDGKYQILGIPVGTYTVKVSSVGFSPKAVTGVKVGADETTSLNLSLTAGDVNLPEFVTSADQILVNSQTTSSNTTITEKKIEAIPNVKGVEDVLKLQPGFVKQGQGLFLRGGRANEVQYVVDGVPVNNVLGSAGSTQGTNEELSKFYQGQANGTIGGGSGGLAVSADAIQSLSVSTSGFDADQGNSQSGVISITTKSGSDKYVSSVQYRTDQIAPSNQNERFMAFNFGGPDPISKYLLPSMGVNLPGKITFFFGATVNRSDGPYNFANNQFYNPVERKIQLNGFLGGLLNGLGFRYRDNQTNKFTFNSNVKYGISSADEVAFRYNASLSSSHGYDNAWKYRADSSGIGASLSIQNVLNWKHFFSGKSFLIATVGKVEISEGNDVAGIKPMDYSSAWDQRDPNADGFNDLGTAQSWYHGLTRDWSARIDFNSQVHPLHLLKTGFEFHYEELVSTEIGRPTVPDVDSAGNVIYPPFPDYKNRNRGEYPGYGIYRWATTAYPNRGAAYLQDNIEFSGLNLHVGLRYDYLDIGKQVYYDDWVSAWKLAVVDLEPEWLQNEKGGSSFLYYVTHGYVSPRLAIGYPVTDRIVFYFNYGHFLQFPDRDNYYRDPFGIGPTNNLVGNPNLKPQRTVAYEASFEDQFSDIMAVKVHAFYKDIFDYATSVKKGDNLVYRNLDYASVRGFEVTFDRAYSENWSGSISYSYQLAKGRASNPLAALFNPQFQLPRETRLDWDQNHTANIFLQYRVDKDEPGKFFGLPFINNYGISLTWSFGSGFPYTPYVPRTTARNVYLTNNETKPYTSTVNLSMYKGLLLMEKLNVMLTLDVTNLFNRRNVIAIFSYTGEPVKYGDVNGDDVTQIYPWRRAEARLDPTIFDAPRQVILGVKLNWE